MLFFFGFLVFFFFFSLFLLFFLSKFDALVVELSSFNRVPERAIAWPGNPRLNETRTVPDIQFDPPFAPRPITDLWRIHTQAAIFGPHYSTTATRSRRRNSKPVHKLRKRLATRRIRLRRSRHPMNHARFFHQTRIQFSRCYNNTSSARHHFLSDNDQSGQTSRHNPRIILRHTLLALTASPVRRRTSRPPEMIRGVGEEIGGCAAGEDRGAAAVALRKNNLIEEGHARVFGLRFGV